MQQYCSNNARVHDVSHLALAALCINPSLLVHVAGLAHQVVLDCLISYAVEAHLVQVDLATTCKG